MRSSAPQEVRCETQEEAVGSSRSLYARAQASLFQEEETRRYGCVCSPLRSSRTGRSCWPSLWLHVRAPRAPKEKKEPLTSSRTRKQKYRDLKKENFSKNRSLIKM
ncbi:hypothetical protein NDU88_001295 [Pleurodeles waltl]|uniref:Uncharacterized protein n=1 Tax=Pleurodeles waltl TaxID=8319 RepID=A0AAV7S9E2_PLEWA|nr:hypothetical protein NDU88_001295 [Pleurodeles waltl]